jgi:hypothetical protein
MKKETIPGVNLLSEIHWPVSESAYSDDFGHPFRGKPAAFRSEATLGISFVP